MRCLSESDLICQLQIGLQSRFDQEEFLAEELAGVVQALVNSVGWTALLTSRRNDWEPVLSLNTDDHFCTEIVDRKQIVSRIENTSGLDRKMSHYALNIIERRVDHEIENESAVEIEHIGVIEAAELPHYTIHLNDELKIAPPDREDTYEEVAVSSLER